MTSKERTREIIKGLYDAVVAFDEGKVVELSHTVLNESVDPYVAVVDGLASGMSEVGDRFNKMVYFVPELLLCSDALYAGLNILKPAILASGGKAAVKGSIVLGVVEGDIHDIGKNLVKVMFEAAGWTVHDLGRDVKLQRFVEEQAKTGSEVVGLSALTTSSMLAMQQAVHMIKSSNPKTRVLVGGAPINIDVAKKFGADGYAPSAGTAVAEAARLVKH
ncbi:MAG: cobalamin-dependent protein [Dehalococcoidia bacterium]|nr:cobalamin-dependent protein [Dehalococcoidia bacterium]